MPADPCPLSSLSLPGEATAAITHFLTGIGGCGLPVVGAYLYGSAARGAYRQPASDVDLIVLTRSSCSDETAARLGLTHATTREHGARLDVMFATREQAVIDELPVPLDLVLPADAAPQRSPGNRGWMFPLDRQDAWECGVPLVGPPTREAITPGPKPVLRAALCWVFPYIAANFKNPELMLCRVTHALLEGRLSSKPEAGRWALTALDPRWHALIERALAERERGGTQAGCSAGELRAFERACAEMIERSTGIAL